MSQVDNRVVQLEFNNSNFEQNVRTSMATLDSLENSLNNLDQREYFQNMNKSIRNVDMTPIQNSCVESANSFNMLEEVVIGVLRRIGEGIADTGFKIAKSLSIDNIGAGFGKYEQELTAVRTIMNATGMSIESVTDQLDKLMQYTDDTSYNYGDMVNAISKFSSYGIELSDAVKYMEGIGNMAGFAGASTAQASHAFEGFAKALGMGKMTYQVWRTWMQNAQVNSAKLKEQYIEAAVAAGTLERGMDGVARTAKGTAVNVGSFDDSLKEGWLNKKVLTDTLSMWGSYTVLVQDIADAWEEANGETMTTFDVMDAMRDGWEDNEEVIKAYAQSVKNATGEEISFEEASKRLAIAVNDLSKKGYESGTVYRTFSDAIDATKDAVSSSWKAIIKNVFGDAETSMDLWTSVGEVLLEVFNGPLLAIKDITKDMGQAGSLQAFIEIVNNLYKTVLSVTDPIKNAFAEVFEPIKGLNITQTLFQIAEFIKQMKLSKDAMVGLQRIAELVLKPLKVIIAILKTIGTVALALVIIVQSLIDRFLVLIGTGELVPKTLKKIFGEERYLKLAAAWEKITTKLSDLFAKLGQKLEEAFSKIAKSEKAQSAFKKLGDLAAAAGNWILDGIVTAVEKLADLDWDQAFSTLSGWIDKIISFGSSLGDILKPIVEGITGFFQGFGGENAKTAKEGIDAVEKAGDAVEKLSDKSELLDKIGGALKTAGEKIGGFFNTITLGKIIALTFAGALAAMVISIAKTVDAAGDFIKAFKGIGDSIKKGIDKITTAVSNFVNSLTFVASGAFITEIAISVGILTASLIALSFVPTEKLKTAGIVLGVVAGGLLALGIAISLLSAANKMTGFGAFATDFVALAAGLGIIALACIGIATIPPGDLVKCGLVIAGVVAIFIGLGVLFSKVKIISAGMKSFSTMMIKLAAALNLLVLPITILSLLDSKKMAIAAAVVAGLITVMTLMSLVFSKCDSMSKNVNKFAVTMILLATAVNLMTVPIMALGLLPLPKLVQGGIAVGLIMVVFAKLAQLFTSQKKMYAGMLKFGGAMALLAEAINLMVIPITILGLLPRKILIQGGITVAGMMAIFTGLAALMKFAPEISANIAKFGAAMALIAVAIGILVPAIFLLGTMTPAVLGQGLVAVIGLAAIFVELSNMAKMSGDTNLKGVIAMCAGISVIVASITILTLLDWDEVIFAAGSLSLTLFTFGKAMESLKDWDVKSALTAAGLILIMMGSLITAFTLMKDIPWTQLAAETGALVVTLAAMAGAMYLFNAIKFDVTNSTAIGIAAMAGAILAIGGAMKLMQGLEWDDVAQGLVAVAGAFAIFLGAAALIGAVPAIAAGIGVINLSLQNLGIAVGIFAAAAVIFSIALATSANAVNTLVGALATLTALGPAGAQAIDTLVEAVTKVGLAISQIVVTTIANLIMLIDDAWAQILAAIAKNAPGISQAAITIGEAILNAIVTLGPQIMEAFATIGQSLISAVETLIPGILNLVSMLLEGIYVLLERFLDELHTLIQMLVDDVLQILRDSGDGLYETIIYLVDLGCQAIEDSVDRVILCAQNVVMSFIGGMRLLIPEVLIGGALIIVSLVSGILSSLLLVADGAAKAIIAFIDGLAESIRENKADLEAAASNLLDALFGDTFFGKVYKLGKSIVTGLFNGMVENANVAKAGGEVVGAASIAGVDEIIQDPVTPSGPQSDVAYTLGQSVDNGMIGGMLSKVGEVFTSGKGVGLESILGMVDGIETGIPFLDQAMGKANAIVGAKNAAATPWDALPEQLDELAKSAEEAKDPMEDLGKATGGANKAAAQYVDTLTKITDYAGDSMKSAAVAIENYLGPSSKGFETVQLGAEQAMQKFAEFLYEESQAAKSAEEIFKQTQDANYNVLAETKKAFIEYRNTIASALQGAGNSFSEFNTEVETTYDDLVSNLEGRRDAIRTWIDNIKQIVVDGASKSMVDQLISMGPESGYATVAAIAEGGEEGVRELSALWDEIGALTTTGTDEIVGTMAASMALTDQQFVANLRATFAAENVMAQMGGVSEGIRDGILKAQISGPAAVRLVESTIESTARLEFAPQVWQPIGGFFSEGIANGITDTTDWIVAAAKRAARAAYEAAMAELDENSPSKVGVMIGAFFDIGIAKGIDEKAYTIEDSASDAASLAIQNAEAMVEAIAGIMETGIEDPVIRPEFDLSAAEQGAEMLSEIISESDWLTSATGSGLRSLKSGVNRLAEDRTYDGRGKGSSVTNYNFTQNNNSPKALSRIDIYRQTKNQFNMLKEVTK